MMATRTFCSAGVLALATIMGPVAPGYAGEPCCAWINGIYQLEDGQRGKAAQGCLAPGPVENAASPADRYCAKPAEATAPPERIYSSMKDCRASLKGKAVHCYKF